MDKNYFLLILGSKNLGDLVKNLLLGAKRLFEGVLKREVTIDQN